MSSSTSLQCKLHSLLLLAFVSDQPSHPVSCLLSLCSSVSILSSLKCPSTDRCPHCAERGVNAGTSRPPRSLRKTITHPRRLPDFWINILLTILGWIPGILHAWYAPLMFLVSSVLVPTPPTPGGSSLEAKVPCRRPPCYPNGRKAMDS